MSENSFSLHQHKVAGNSGEIICNDNFYINQDDTPGIFHCFAYGDSLWLKDYSVNKVCGAYISFNFYLEGNALIEYQGRKYEVRAGDLVMAMFRNSFRIRTGDAGIVRKRCLLLSYTPLQSIICRQLLPDDLTIIHIKNSDAVSGILDRISNEIKSDGNREKLAHLILDFFHEIQRQQESSNYPDVLKEALRFIARPDSGKIGRQELARHCRVSISTLNRLFQTFLKCSPGQYILNQQLALAARLLVLGNMSIKQVAYDAGFSSPNFFDRIFRKYYNMTPKEFQRRQGDSNLHPANSTAAAEVLKNKSEFMQNG